MEIIEFKKKTQKEILCLQEYEIADGQGGRIITVPVLEFSLLESTGIVSHCFTTRMGGVSSGIFESMNLSFTRGDEPEAVMENYRRIAGVMNCQAHHSKVLPDDSRAITIEDFICTDQTHTTNVMRVDDTFKGFGVTKDKPYTDIDGLITNVPGVVLSAFYADCVPLYFVDPVHKAIGLSHSGWRGTAGRMGLRTLEAMKEAYGTCAEDVYAAIGPSICQDCYEISEDVAEHFYKEFEGHGDEILINKGNGKYQLDLWKCNEIVMLEAGIKKEHLAVTNICTCCNDKLLFSHRASHGQRGNLGAFLCLKDCLL